MIKKILLPLLAVSLVMACNNEGKEKHDEHGSKNETAKTPADSLYEEVMSGHDEVMPKMGKVRGAQARAKALLDSIARLPVKAQDAAAGLKKDLESLVSELNNADFSMDKWMTEFKMDSAENDPGLRLKYLAGEKEKVMKVKEAVLSGLARADSLLKAKTAMQ
ncbi:MAG: viral A-type inclusion protein [Sphingobacteriales bacterium]|nr:viral A-type inclusion protein [Sphingobacteriales bacterium]